MASFLSGGRSRVYGDAYVFGHTEYQRIDRMGDADRYGIVAYPSDIQYYIIEGGIIALLSWRFFFRKRYDRIIARYDDESPVQRKSGAWVLALYVVSTIAVFLLGSVATARKNMTVLGFSARFGTACYFINPIFAAKTT